MFFFFTSRTITSPFFQERLQIYIVVLSVLGWEGGERGDGGEGAGAMISRSPISPPILFPGLTLGTKLDFHFDCHKLMKVRRLASVVETLDSVIPPYPVDKYRPFAGSHSRGTKPPYW